MPGCFAATELVTDKSLKKVTAYHEIHQQLIDLSKAGNTRAQHQLYDLYAKAMFNICYRMMNNREDAEDMLQESFAEAFLSISTFRAESTFGAWLKRITVNKCINALKRRRPELVTGDFLPERPETEDPEVDMRGLTVERVQQAMEQLPPGYRIVFSLYLLEGYDHGEIAQILNITEATSKSQYLRARKRIKEIILQQTHERQI